MTLAPIRASVLGAGLLLAAGCQTPGLSLTNKFSAAVIDERADVLDLRPADFRPPASLGQPPPRLRLHAAQGETIGVQVVLRGASSNVRIEGWPAGAITTERFAVLPIRVGNVPSWYPEHTRRGAIGASMPDVLVPWPESMPAPPAAGGFSLGADQIVWLDLTPQSASPGVYEARVVAGDGVAQSTLATIALHVHALRLSGPAPIPVLARLDPRELSFEGPAATRDSAARTRLLPGDPVFGAAIGSTRAAFNLLHDHGLSPVLWASFPPYQDTNDLAVSIDWSGYDALVAGWIDGSAYADNIGAAWWPIPVAADYPDPERYGGFESARYSRVLAAYLQACEAHFAERGWRLKAFARPDLPLALSGESATRWERLAAIHRTSETAIPLALHAPRGQLRSLGWVDAPAVELPDSTIHIGPGLWHSGSDGGSGSAWLMPDAPPYCGALTVASAAVDAQIIPWIARRYRLDAIWLEHAADRGATNAPSGAADPRSDPLLYAGRDFGSGSPVLPSIRLKRLRRGLADLRLLSMLEQRGQSMLVDQIAAQVVPWALAEAGAENLLATRGRGWSTDPQVLRLAHRRVLSELSPLADAPEPSIAPPTAAAPSPPPASAPSDAAPPERPGAVQEEADWRRLLGANPTVDATVRGVRIVGGESGMQASVFTAVSNAGPANLSGRWTLVDPPTGWEPGESEALVVPPGERRLGRLPIALGSFSYDVDGTYPFTLRFGGEGAADTIEAAARLAIVAAPPTQSPPTIDGDLQDWVFASNNAVGDFLLVRGGADRKPAHETQAFFALDAENLYIAIRAATDPDKELVVRSDNEIDVDRAAPWGQELVEVLLDPRGVPDGTSGDIYCLQIKPNALVIARKGCRTNPPMGPSVAWSSEARAATARGRSAWFVELAIPLAAFGPAAQRGNIWGCNITRLDAERGEYASWSGTTTTCYLPLTMGNLILLRR